MVVVARSLLPVTLVTDLWGIKRDALGQVFGPQERPSRSLTIAFQIWRCSMRSISPWLRPRCPSLAWEPTRGREGLVPFRSLLSMAGSPPLQPRRQRFSLNRAERIRFHLSAIEDTNFPLPESGFGTPTARFFCRASIEQMGAARKPLIQSTGFCADTAEKTQHAQQ
jgi:hypothetical protein